MKDFVRAAKEDWTGLECKCLEHHAILHPPGQPWSTLSLSLCDQICIIKHPASHRKSSVILPELRATVRTLLDVLTS